MRTAKKIDLCQTVVRQLASPGQGVATAAKPEKQSPIATRIFRAGNSQAVRIPKAFELPLGDVVIEQRDGGLFINTRRGKWNEFFATLEPLDLTSALQDVRVNDTPRPVDMSWL